MTPTSAPTTLEEQLVRDEREVLHAYPDSEGYLTIGVGTCIDARAGCGITRDESRYLLRNRIAIAEQAVAEKLPWTNDLDPVRRAVLENMAFNEGIAHLLDFQKMLTALAARDYETAAAEMLDSLWAKEVGDRAHRLAKQMETGEWV